MNAHEFLAVSCCYEMGDEIDPLCTYCNEATDRPPLNGT